MRDGSDGRLPVWSCPLTSKNPSNDTSRPGFPAVATLTLAASDYISNGNAATKAAEWAQFQTQTNPNAGRMPEITKENCT